MAAFSTDKIRNIALVGHRSSGKTSLAEAALFATGASGRLGQVDAGTTTTDFVPEEIERKLSISPALCVAQHQGFKINLIDTPGYAEFYSEVIPCIWVADAAILVLDGIAGVEVHSRKVYAAAAARSLPTLAVVNKLDKEHSNLDKVIAQMNDTLPDCKAVAVQIPIGRESEFTGVVDLLSMKAVIGAGKDAKEAPIPDDLAAAAEAARGALVEEVASTDEALMELFFENESLTQDELIVGLKKAVAGRALIPVLCSSATNLVGTRSLLDFISLVAPSPADLPAWKGHKPDSDEVIEVPADTTGSLAAVIWKTMRDPFIGRMCLVRVISGELRGDGQAQNPRTGHRERLTGLVFINGKETQPTDALSAGDMACVTKLEDSTTGDTLCEQRHAVIFDMPSLPEGMHTAAMSAESRADEDKLSGALAQVSEEDIGFTAERVAETNELIARGMGPLHLHIIRDQLLRKFKVKVNLGEPEVPYRETVRKSVRVQGRHKKQTGGRGQFGDVWLRVEPQVRGAGFEFVNGVSGGSVPTNYIPAVEKGVADALGTGPLAKFPIVDIKVTLDDGSAHAVDSSDMAFRLAAQIGMRKAMADAAPMLLEPVVMVEVTCPDDILGDVMSDVSGRRGRLSGTEQIGGQMQLVKALVPLGEMTTYSSDLTSMSQGRASYTMEMSHYEEVPAHIQEAIVAKRGGGATVEE